MGDIIGQIFGNVNKNQSLDMLELAFSFSAYNNPYFRYFFFRF